VITRLSREFDLTPAARSRIIVPAPDDSINRIEMAMAAGETAGRDAASTEGVTDGPARHNSQDESRRTRKALRHAVHRRGDRGWFGVSVRTIERRRKQRKFRDAMERGKAKGRISVRRLQMKLLEEGNATMGVWLGKQMLGQTNPLNHPLNQINNGFPRLSILIPNSLPGVSGDPAGPLSAAPAKPDCSKR